MIQDEVEFSIANKIEAILEVSIDELDHGGSYRICAKVKQDIEIRRVGVYLNNSFEGTLVWDLFHQEYEIIISLEYPGIWQITVFAESTLNEFDFEDKNIGWIVQR